jgi:hypothetical protein
MAIKENEVLEQVITEELEAMRRLEQQQFPLGTLLQETGGLPLRIVNRLKARKVFNEITRQTLEPGKKIAEDNLNADDKAIDVLLGEVV